MRQKLLAAIALVMYTTAIILGLQYTVPQPSDSSACRSSAAQIGLQVEYMIIVRPYLSLNESALDGYVRTARLARQLMAERIALDCAVDFAACDTELRDVLVLKVSPSKAELAECIRLTGNEDLLSGDNRSNPSGVSGGGVYPAKADQ